MFLLDHWDQENNGRNVLIKILLCSGWKYGRKLSSDRLYCNLSFKKLFGEDAGVSYYGEVIETAVVPRKEINDLGGRTNPSAMCYKFTIKKWVRLNSKIEFEKDWVYRPRYSNFFCYITANLPLSCLILGQRRIID